MKKWYWGSHNSFWAPRYMYPWSADVVIVQKLQCLFKSTPIQFYEFSHRSFPDFNFVLQLFQQNASLTATIPLSEPSFCKDSDNAFFFRLRRTKSPNNLRNYSGRLFLSRKLFRFWTRRAQITSGTVPQFPNSWILYSATRNHVTNLSYMTLHRTY